MKRHNISKYQGVYYRESANRRYLGKPDRCFDICFRDHSGKLIWEKIGWMSEGYSAAVAHQIRSERIRALRHGEDLPQKAKAVSFADIWEKYDHWLETSKKRPRDDRGLYNNHLKSRFATKKLSDISPFDLEKMKSELTKDGLSPATVKHCLVLVRQIFNKAVAWGMWQGENPISKVTLPRLNNRRVRFLSVDEADLLLSDLSEVSEQLHDMSYVSLYSGMRASEVFALRWGHIDVENGIIHVADPKGIEARKAFMTPGIISLFKNRQRGTPDELVFKDRNGIQIKEVSNAFTRAVDRMGFNKGINDLRQKVTFHTLRHTFASWLAIQGTPLLTIRDLLGHKSLAMTERYSHLIPDCKKEAVRDLEKFVEMKKEQSRNSVVPLKPADS